MFQHILLPTDGSQLSRDTAERAVAFAKAAGARVTALYARPVGQMDNYGDLVQPAALDRLVANSEGKSKEYLGFIRKLCKEAGVDCTTLSVVNDSPWEAIINVAEEQVCDLIFMSKHGRGGLSSLLLGSETYRVLTHSSIPVLVYRPPEMDASAGARRARRRAKRSARGLEKPAAEKARATRRHLRPGGGQRGAASPGLDGLEGELAARAAGSQRRVAGRQPARTRTTISRA